MDEISGTLEIILATRTAHPNNNGATLKTNITKDSELGSTVSALLVRDKQMMEQRLAEMGLTRFHVAKMEIKLYGVLEAKESENK